AGGSELCNGLDDDCDSHTDELWPALGTACNNGQRYTCKRTGVVECAPDGMSARCSAETIVPAPETCNGKDDDCDGIADEDTPAHPIGAPVGDACGGGSTCSAGFFVCDHGALRCDTSHAAAELCNGKDDDCNGLIDDGVTTEVGLPCDGPASGASTGADQGECAPGKTACLNGAIQCTSYVGPADEVCNGKDDDCDGASDEHAFCPNAGGVCLHAQCVVPCGKGGCPFAYYCAQLPQGGYCVPDPCVTVSCDSDEVCEHGSGKCAKICAEAVCEPGETCVAGVCVDCFTAPCARGQLCVANARGVGVCQADRCATKSCAARSEACIDGECIALECDPSCAADESCVLGRCVADRCEDLRCAAGMLCDPKRGACVNDRCDGVACSQGMVCDREKGRCVPDRCVTTVCPSGSNCVVRFDGSPYCAHPTRAALSEAGWRNQDSPVAQGGGGFSCSLAGPGAAPALLSARWLGMACVLWLILSLRLRSRRKRKSVRVPGCDAPCC
ncbi:MAG TPA: MopE-related protein, partial [Polyangiales bacterium]|nr:MopE-related protein [Polyangiales bacterium]